MSATAYKLYETVVQTSENLNVRDKTVKVIQYGARLILGYQSAFSLSQESLDTAKGVSTTGSNACKFFRLFKSIKSLKVVSEALMKILSSPKYDAQTILHFLQQLCWVRSSVRCMSSSVAPFL